MYLVYKLVITALQIVARGYANTRSTVLCVYTSTNTRGDRYFRKGVPRLQKKNWRYAIIWTAPRNFQDFRDFRDFPGISGGKFGGFCEVSGCNRL